MKTKRTANLPAKAVEITRDRKTGFVSATYASQASCSDSCAFKGSGCMAELGPMAWANTGPLNAHPDTSDVGIAKAEAQAIDALSGRFDLRLHVVGDCRTNRAAKIVSAAAERFSVRKFSTKVWTYTHSWRNVKRESWGKVSVLASCETVDDIRKARAKGYNPAIVVESHPSDILYMLEGEPVLPCPAETRGVQCVECRLCLDDGLLRRLGFAIGFSAHGAAPTIKRALATLRKILKRKNKKG